MCVVGVVAAAAAAVVVAAAAAVRAGTQDRVFAGRRPGSLRQVAWKNMQ